MQKLAEIILSYRRSAILADVKATTVAGGTSSNTTWNTRDLNTKQYDPYGIVTISSNKFVPIAGDYQLFAYTPFLGGAAGTALGRARLFNVTTAVAVQQGQSGAAVTNTNSVAILDCVFTANGSDEFRIDTYTSVGRATNGLGLASGDGSSEIYTVVVLKKIA